MLSQNQGTATRQRILRFAHVPTWCSKDRARGTQVAAQQRPHQATLDFAPAASKAAAPAHSAHVVGVGTRAGLRRPAAARPAAVVGHPPGRHVMTGLGLMKRPRGADLVLLTLGGPTRNDLAP